MKIKKSCCLGVGYAGEPMMAVIADKCPHISENLVDFKQKRTDDWNDENLGNLPIYESGLDQVEARARHRNLFFSIYINEAIANADKIFNYESTPTKTYGKGKGMAADLKYIQLYALQIAKVSKDDKIILEKSTLPVRTAESLKTILNVIRNGVKFQVLSNPEFLTEVTAVADLHAPDRVLIGGGEDVEGQLESR